MVDRSRLAARGLQRVERLVHLRPPQEPARVRVGLRDAPERFQLVAERLGVGSGQAQLLVAVLRGLLFEPILQRRGLTQPLVALLKRLRLAVNSLVTYSDLAPRVFAAAGTLMIVGPLLYGSIVLLQYLFAGRSLPQGLTMIVLLITFLGGTIMLALGVLGLYIFRIFQEVLARPRYVIDETMNLERFPHGRS